MSTSVAPNGRCHFDPKLMPMPTPGPTSTTDDIQPARKVPGLAFGRATEPRSKSPDPAQRVTKRDVAADLGIPALVSGVLNAISS